MKTIDDYFFIYIDFSLNIDNSGWAGGMILK